MADIDKITNLAIDRLLEVHEKYDYKDRKFEELFGSFERPSFARKYNVKLLVNRYVNYSLYDESIIDVAPMIRSLNKEDRYIVAEIVRFVYQYYDSKYATDKTLNLFKLELIKRLEDCGFSNEI